MIKNLVALLSGVLVFPLVPIRGIAQQAEVEIETNSIPAMQAIRGASALERASTAGRRPTNRRAPQVQKPDLTEAQNKIRQHRADVIKKLGVELDWTRFNASELLDIELRIRKAGELRKLGYRAVWESESLAELTDKEARISTSRRLEAKGVLVNWATTPLEKMIALESRIDIAERLKRLGRPVDWQNHSVKELAGMETELLVRRRNR